jgi:beta-glucosidase
MTANQDIEQRVEELLGKLTLKEKVALLSGKDLWNTVPIERLGIPSIVMTDGPHGVRASNPETGRVVGPATSFPTGVSMASSWNPELIERVGAALGEETRGMGCDILLGPCVNIVRVPLAGRNFESYSEDPYLAGRIGVAWVKGVQSRQVGASLKHFACNNQEIERLRGNSAIDERTLREIYLPAFEAIVKEAQPWTVMCSYNRINGVYASQNNHLLNEILREEWGFDGAVVSDWGANHTTVESVKGGLDIEMPGPAKYYGKLLLEAVRTWQIDEAVVDNAARRILRTILRSGRLDDSTSVPTGAANTPEHQALARELAEESIVLLKNDNRVLPLHKDRIKSIAVIGPNAAEARIGGGGSSFLEPPYRVSPLDALKARLGDGVAIGYEQGCDNYTDLPPLKSEYVTPAGGSGHGLKAEYFDNTDLSGKPAHERIDQKLRYWWFGSSPAENVPADKFSARWTGQLTVPASGSYTFKVMNVGTCRLYVDGQLLIENRVPEVSMFDHSRATVSANLELAGGRAYEFKVEFVKLAGDDFALVEVSFGTTPGVGQAERIARAVELARKSDVAIIFGGMPEGFESEGGDRPHMELPGPQAELIRAVAAANQATIVVLNCGSPVAMPWLADVPAVLETFYPGQEGGNAIANILLGEVNPSGKLSTTFPKRLEDSPAFINYPGGKEVLYGEGIFVGYRYYDKKDVEPLFPFGFGLSYTTFDYSQLQAPQESKIGEPVHVSVTVKNAGDVHGKEVAQLYVGDKEASLPRPPKELKAFAKVTLLPGESTTVSFVLDRRAFAFYDPDQKGWCVEPGEYEILVGSSSRDIRARATVNLVA